MAERSAQRGSGVDTLRDRWRAETYRSSLISDSVRVLLLLLADFMDARGNVSKPRRELAALLGRDERRVAERFKAACEAGFLYCVSPGRPGRTAVYRATLSAHRGADGRTPEKGADSSTHEGADGRTPKPPSKGADGQHAIEVTVGTTVSGGSDADASTAQHRVTSAAGDKRGPSQPQPRTDLRPTSESGDEPRKRRGGRRAKTPEELISEDPAYAFDCPTCDAVPGERCRDVNPSTYIHSKRRQRAGHDPWASNRRPRDAA